MAVLALGYAGARPCARAIVVGRGCARMASEPSIPIALSRRGALVTASRFGGAAALAHFVAPQLARAADAPPAAAAGAATAVPVPAGPVGPPPATIELPYLGEDVPLAKALGSVLTLVVNIKLDDPQTGGATRASAAAEARSHGKVMTRGRRARRGPRRRARADEPVAVRRVSIAPPSLVHGGARPLPSALRSSAHPSVPAPPLRALSLRVRLRICLPACLPAPPSAAELQPLQYLGTRLAAQGVRVLAIPTDQVPAVANAAECGCSVPVCVCVCVSEVV
jgi:hypothetical protein